MWPRSRHETGLRLRTPMTRGVISLGLLLAVASPVAAAGGTSPTAFNTGSVTCRDDLIQLSSNLSTSRPVMQTGRTYFNGYFGATSVVQYSTDQGATWHYWSGTKRSHGLTRVYGYGASAFHNVTWGPWPLSGTPTAYAMRVKTTFRWLNRNKVLLATRVRFADYYRTETYWPDNPFGSLTTSNKACVLLLR
jgi:hypothetical protein